MAGLPRERRSYWNPQIISGQFPESREPESSREKLEDTVEVVTDEYIEQRYEPTGTYVVKHRVMHRFFLDIQQVQDMFPSIYSLTEPPQKQSQYVLSPMSPLIQFNIRSEPSQGIRTELRCGTMVLPLQSPYDIRDENFIESFGISPESRLDDCSIQREAIRTYSALEAKAARGNLTNSEELLWKRICEIVDRKKVTRLRELSKPRRSLGQVVDEGSGRTVKWVSGLILPLSHQAVQALDILDINEWFEANIVQDPDGNIIDLRNVDIRSDYRLASDMELDEFFKPLEG